jgi:phage-related protein (TIGR01555 family)
MTAKTKKSEKKSRISKVIDAVRSFRQDTWANVITGLGTTRDKVEYAGFSRRALLDEDTLETMYSQDDMASRVCDVIPEEALRQSFHVKIEASDDDPDEIEDPELDFAEPEPSILDSNEAVKASGKLNKRLKALKATEKFIEAATWARLFGGAAILLGADDGATEKTLKNPLRPERVSNITFLNVIDKRYLCPMSWNFDPMSPNFGKPETFMMTSQPIQSAHTTTEELFNSHGAVEIHQSRLIIFDGAKTTNIRRVENQGFGNSVLERFYDPLRQFQITWQAITHLAQDSPQAKFKMQGLIDMISSGDAETIQTRMQITDMGRSVARAVILDAEMEDFERQATTFTDIPDLLDKFMIRLSAAARMPVTILMGQSPAGLDATGESDIRWFYDQVASYQEEYLKPKLEYLTKLIFMSQDGPTNGKMPTNWRVEFPSLWQMTPSEEVDLRNKQADTDKMNIDSGILLPEEVAMSRYGADGYSTDTTIDLSTRKKTLKTKLKKIEKFTKEMPQFGLPKGWQAQFLPMGVPGSPEEEFNEKKAVQGPEPHEPTGATGPAPTPTPAPDKKKKTDARLAHVHEFNIDGKRIYTTSDGGGERHSHRLGTHKTSTSSSEPGHTHSIGGILDLSQEYKTIMSGPPEHRNEES